MKMCSISHPQRANRVCTSEMWGFLPDIYYISLGSARTLSLIHFRNFPHSSLSSAALSPSWSPTEIKFRLCVVPSQHASSLCQNCNHAALVNEILNTIQSQTHLTACMANHLFKSHLSRKHWEKEWIFEKKWKLNLMTMITKLHMFWLHSAAATQQNDCETREIARLNLFIISGLILNYPASEQRSEAIKNMFVI